MTDDSITDSEIIDDSDNPEWTDEDFARARPFKEVLPEVYAAWKNKGGRPKVDNPKVHLGLRVAADLAAAIKAHGKGYGNRVETILREALEQGRL